MSFFPLVDIPRTVGNFGAFYVPRFEIKIAGADLPGEVLRDVTQLTYHDDIDAIDGFELTVNNWDESRQDFKYLGSGLEASAREDLERVFDPCKKDVVVSFGYGDDVRPIVTGNFTTVEPTFPSSGPATLAVRGLNVLHRLRRKQHTYAWIRKTDSFIATNLASLSDPDTGHKRFPIPIVTNDHARARETPIPYVAQRNQYDIDFLLRRARERGYVVLVRPRQGGRSPQDVELYFGPSQEPVAGHPQVEYELAWRQSLIDFTPTLTTANQVRSVTVNGWDRSARRPISATVTLDDPRVNVNRDIRKILESCDPREEIVVDEPVSTAREADDLACARLLDRHRAVVKAKGTCLGIPGLRAGARVNIVGLGTTFSGVYFLTSTTHTINDGGYTVRFEARREVTQ